MRYYFVVDFYQALDYVVNRMSDCRLFPSGAMLMRRGEAPAS